MLRRPISAVAIAALWTAGALSVLHPDLAHAAGVGHAAGANHATAAATAKAVAPPPSRSGFLATPTDQIAVPGMLAGAEITPEGDLYTGWAEYELRFGRRLLPWDQPTRTLRHPALPALSSTLFDGPVRYTLRVFAVPVSGRPVAYQTIVASNEAGSPRTARVAMQIAYTRGARIRGAHRLFTRAYRYERPVTAGADGYYEQLGQPFSPAFLYSVAGRDLDRSGLLLARGPRTPSKALKALAADTPTTPHDRLVFHARLRAHRRISFTWQIPLDPPPAGRSAGRALDSVPLSLARRRLDRLWAAEEAGMARIQVPEARVSAAYRAAVAEILTSRYHTPLGWVQAVNRLQYQAFWIRDAALETQALDLAGLHRQAAQNLAFLDGWQQPDGLLISRAGQYDGLGQALWAIARHAELAGRPAYAATQLPRIQAAIGWLSQESADDPLGLLPSGEPGDDELAAGHIAGDDLWAAAGLRSAVADARLAGREDLAAEWQAVDDRFEVSLDGAISAAVASAGHIPPVLDAAGGQDWGNYNAAYPVEVLSSTSPAVQATVAWAKAHMAQGLATYEDRRSLHDYLGFPIFQTELSEGDVSDAVAGLYSELAHTTSTYGGWEWGVSPFGQRGSPADLAPHGTFAADYVALLRNMLLSEEPDGSVSLLGGASPAWLAPGQRIAVRDAPTDRGVISFTERSSAYGETLTWRGSLDAGTRLTWTLPSWARHIRLQGRPVSGGTIVLPGRSGSIALTFEGRRPSQSYASTVKALNALYQAHGRPAPLVVVRGR